MRQPSLNVLAHSHWSVDAGGGFIVDGRVHPVDDSDVEFVVVVAGVGFLVLDHLHGAPPGREVELYACLEDGLRVRGLAAGFGVEDAGEFWGDSTGALSDGAGDGHVRKGG